MNTIREEMAHLRCLILRLIETEPDNVDAREPLWMRREELRASLMDGTTAIGATLALFNRHACDCVWQCLLDLVT